MPAPVVLASIGVLVVSLDSSLNIALPAMASAFGIGAATIRWVIICYVLTYALTAFAAGVLADHLGASRVFMAGFWVSGLAFAAYLAAPSFAGVLALRVAQGVGGGLIYGTAPALVTQALPRERHGRGLGVMSLGLGVGMTVGPVLGGLLVHAFGWRGVFVYRAPIAIAVAVIATASTGLPRVGTLVSRLPLSRAILRVEVLRHAALAFLANYAQFAIWLLVPFYLVSARGVSPVAGGFLFALTPFTTALTAPCAGWAADRLGARWPAIAGLAVETAGLFAISRLDGESTLGQLGVGLVLVGLGVGLFQVSNLAQMMAAFPRSQQGAAGGLAFLGRTLGSAVGVQITATLFDARLPAEGFLAAFRWAFLGASAAAGLATLIGLLPLGRAGREPGAA
jgi:MFS family permease